MILTCPSCGTQYVVKDDAIPPGGRQVRCASCKHSWHQDQEESVEPEPQMDSAPEALSEEPEEQAEAAPRDEEESLAEATMIEPRSGPEIEERAFEEAAIASDSPPGQVSDAPPPDTDAPFEAGKEEAAETPAADWKEPPQAEAEEEDEFSPYPAADEEQPRRPRPVVAILLAMLLIAALAAAFWFLAPPQWKARLGLGAGGASPLALVTTHMDRQKLESGNELLTVTGRVINPTASEQDVPPLQAQLRARGGKVVYSWTIAPPARSLPAGASASFNSAEVNVPPGGDELTITLGSGRA